MSDLQTKRRRVNKDFFWHLSVYLIVNSGLVIINLASSSDTIWFIWPLLGWGVGLVFHALSVFVFKDWADADNNSENR